MYIYTILESSNQVSFHMSKQSVVFQPFPAIIVIGELRSLLVSGMLASVICFSLANKWLTRRLLYFLSISGITCNPVFHCYNDDIDYPLPYLRVPSVKPNPQKMTDPEAYRFRKNHFKISLDNNVSIGYIHIMTKEELKQWQKINGHTQQTLANALGVHRTAIARWETGAREIPSFLHLALRCLELEGGEPIERDKRKLKTKKGGERHG